MAEEEAQTTPDPQGVGTSQQDILRSGGEGGSLPDAPPVITQRDRNQIQRQDEADAPSFGEAFSMGRELDAVGPALQDWMAEEDFEDDPGFQIDKDLWDKLTEDIPVDDQDIFLDVESEEEALHVREQYKKERAVEEELQKAGWSGTGARLLAGVLDETALGAIIATEGAATPWIFSAKASRMVRTLRASGAAATTESSLQTFVQSQRETKGPQDAFYAGLMAAGIGAPFGALARPIGNEANAANKSIIQNDNEHFHRAAKEVEEEQLLDTIQSATYLERGEAEAAVSNLRQNHQRLRDIEEQLEQARTERARADNEMPQERVLREEGTEATPETAMAARQARDEARAADEDLQQAENILQAQRTSRGAEAPGTRARADEARERGERARGELAARERDLDDEVLQALTPRRQHGVGRKEAHKIGRRARDRTAQAARAQPFDAEDARVRESDLGQQVEDLRQLIRGQQSELDETARRAQIDGRRVLARDMEDGSVFQAQRRDRTSTPEEGAARAGTSRSAGAAETEGTMPQRADESPINEERVPDEVSRRARNMFQKVRIDMTGRLMASESNTMSFLARTLFSDPLAGDSGRRVFGRNETPEVREHAGAELQDRIFTAAAVHFLKNALPAYQRWARNQGLNWWKRNFNGHHRQQFFEDVTHAIRTGSSPNEEVEQAARSIREVHESLLEKAKQANLAGFDDVQANMRYIHRMWEPNKISNLVNDRSVGGEGVVQLIEKSIRRADPEVDASTARSMATAVYRRFNAKGHNVQSNFNQRFFGRDLEEVRRVLREGEDIPEGDIENIMTYLRMRDQGSQDTAGAITHARSRIPMDEDTSVTLETGRTVHFSELTENNAERIMMNYTRNVSGHIAVARALKPHIDEETLATYGVRTDYEFDRLKQVAASERATDHELNNLQMGYNLLTGRPPETNTNTAMHQVLRFVRDWNFTRLMGQVGFAQIAEWGPVMSQVGVITLLRNVPKFREIVQRSRNGDMQEPMLRELEEFGYAIGAERMIMQPHYRMEDHGMEVNSGMNWLNNASNTVEVLKRGVGDASGMSGITLYMQRMAGLSAGQKMLKMAKRGELDTPRMRSLGIDEEMSARLQDQLARFGGSRQMESGRYADVLNLERWDDAEAREFFLNAMHRWGSRMVQRNLVGELPAFMHTVVGQLLGQFRSFMMNAYQKQLLQGVNMKDMQTFTSFTFSMMFAGAAYSAQHSLNSLGRSDAEEYREERLNMTNLMLSSFQRAGFASLIPGAVDTIAPMTPMLDEGIFRYGRSSGLATDFLTGNPTVDFWDSLHGGAQGALAAPFRDDYQFSQSDFQNLWRAAALNNVTGIRNLGDQINEELPRQSTMTPASIEDYLGIDSVR